jgi:tetratricopeptide (TPR) repeat protein
MTCAGGTALLFVLATPAEGAAFKNVGVGDRLEQASFRTLDGKQAEWLGPPGQVTAFMFVRPDQEFSRVALEQLAQCQQRLSGKPIYWVVIVSDAYPAAEVKQLLAASGAGVPVLVDVADAHYGKLGVILHPVVGVADGERRLAAYAPFRKVNYCNLMEATLRRALGEIDDAALAAIVDPPRLVTTSDAAALARRNLKMAKMLYDSGKHEKALEMAQKLIVADATLAGAHGIVAGVLAARGDCGGAGEAVQKALAADPAEPMALAAQQRCSDSAQAGAAPTEPAAPPEPPPQPAAAP